MIRAIFDLDGTLAEKPGAIPGISCGSGLANPRDWTYPLCGAQYREGCRTVA